MGIIYIPLDLQLAPGRALAPQRDGDGVVALVIQDSGRDGEVDLVADVLQALEAAVVGGKVNKNGA